MAKDTNESLESQAEAAQEATPDSSREVVGRTPSGAGGLTGWYRGATQPIRDAFQNAGTRFDKLPQAYRYAVIAALIAGFALVPFILHAALGIHAAYWLNVTDKIGIAALLALGLNVVVGYAGLLDLGYVAFFAVGAYSYALLTQAARYSVLIEAQTPQATALAQRIKPVWHEYFWLYFFAALAIALLAGVLLGAPTLRLRGDYLAIVTLGFGEIIRDTANNLHSVVGGPRGVFNLPHPAIGSYDFGLQNEPYYWLLLGIIVIWIFLLMRLNRSRIGRAWAAIREDELAAAAMGVSTIRMKLWAFAIGASVASFGGVVYASKIIFISPDSFRLFGGDFASVIILAMVVLGGMGGIAGPIVGAALLVFLPERFRVVGDARFMLFGLALVVVMILRPQGLIPSRRRAAELKGGEVRETTVFEAREHGA
ncbi:MAG TPA: branched-chain amino acid ABC transporter permease [Actinomycetota bacterium]